nr:hypothetical protein [Tanacetum cinerariifolium]
MPQIEPIKAMNTVEELRDGGLIGIHVRESLRSNPGGGGETTKGYLGIQLLGSNGGGDAGVDGGLNEGMFGCQDLGSPGLSTGGLGIGGKFDGGYWKNGGCGGVDVKGGKGGN